MKEYELNFRVELPFGNLFRKAHVLIVVLDNESRVLTGLKPGFLPDGVSRFLGGGVKTDETAVQAAVRELNEEMGIVVDADELEEMFRVKTHAVDRDGREYDPVTTVFLYHLTHNNYQASDDVIEIARLTLEELEELATKHYVFDEDFWYEGREGKHRWADYGKLYGPIHKWAHEYLSEHYK